MIRTSTVLCEVGSLWWCQNSILSCNCNHPFNYELSSTWKSSNNYLLCVCNDLEVNVELTYMYAITRTHSEYRSLVEALEWSLCMPWKHKEIQNYVCWLPGHTRNMKVWQCNKQWLRCDAKQYGWMLSTFHRNAGNLLPDHTASQPRTLQRAADNTSWSSMRQKKSKNRVTVKTTSN